MLNSIPPRDGVFLCHTAVGLHLPGSGNDRKFGYFEKESLHIYQQAVFLFQPESLL